VAQKSQNETLPQILIMLVKEKLGNLQSFNIGRREVDAVELEWFETAKRIMHKQSTAGRPLVIKFMKESQQLRQDDVIYADDALLVSVNIKPCEAIVITPGNTFDMAYICYEIGNKHLPLFYEEEQLLIPYEPPVFQMLQKGGFDVRKENRKLLNQFRSSVTAHAHSGETISLFSRIMQLTTRSADA
jgi:urease accessory protein